jgi:hypothetical protein
MKTIIISLISLMLISATGSFAKTANTDNPTKVEKLLKKMIAFPDFAKKEKMEGIVLVSFTVNNDGTLSVNLTNESSESLKEYVLDKLSQIKLKPGNSEAGKTYNVKFEFKFEK